MTNELIEREAVHREIVKQAKDICSAVFKDKDCVFRASHNCVKTRETCVDWHDEIEEASINIITTLTAERDALRDALEPSCETKIAYMSEFSFARDATDEDGNEGVEYITVPWTTIKAIMAAISTQAALKGQS